jgi:hypothetical protein
MALSASNLPPPPMDSALAEPGGPPSPTWARWLHQLWDVARLGPRLRAFRAFGQAADNWSGSPASKTSGAFATGGGPLLILASSSAYRVAQGAIGFFVDVDAAEVGQMSGYTNEPTSHKACVPAFILASGVAAGQHTIRVRQFAGQLANADDPLDVLVLELPAY